MLTLAASTAHAQSCGPDPLAGRALYLRGSFNAWNATDAQRMAWACDRWSVVTRLPAGEQAFKFGDEGWSAEADFGAASPDATRALLKSRGGVREFNRRFAAGTYRISLTMNHELRIETCPAEAAPLGATTLYLRGTMNNWAALDEFAFRFSCDAYYLNVKLDGRHEFKIADAAWTGATSYGAGQGAYLQEGGGNLARAFAGEHTLRLAWAGGRPELSIGPRTFADPQLQAVADPVARSLAFDSRALVHKAPFGAVVAGSELRFALDALPGIERLTLVVEKRRLEGNQEVLEYTELARVPMRRSPAASPAEAGRERWQASHRFGEVGVYGYWFEAEIGGRRYVVQNNRHPLHWTREKGTGGAAEVAELPAARGTIRRFRQTVYAADFKVPDWAADAVYYYIFPERFRNGDKTNDPQPGVAKYHDGTVERHAKWNEPPFKPGDGRGDDRHNNDFFGGDLAGIVDKLDYIRDLGANTIYMTPVFRAASNHKYDTADYKQIDPGFGSNADFERLTREAARRGMRVIPDASLNHVGQDSRYFDRFGNFAGGDAGPPQVSSPPPGGGSGADRPWGRRESGAFEGGRINAASPYFGWFSFDATQREPDKQYKGWVGIADLPELNKASPEFRRFAYRERDSVMKFWLDRGAAGWRMDVAPWVPDDFWREWRAEIKRHRPDALTVAETWFDSSKYFLGDMFDSTMNYVFRNAVLAWAAGGSAREMVEHLEAIREAYPPQAFHALMNLLSTHDAPRALHQFGWHEDTRDPARIAEAKRRLVLAAFFQMTYPGAPAIYYGDEVGVTGGEDPYNRATYPWADEGGSPDMALHAEFAKLVALRNAHAILRRGELLAPLHVDEHVVVLARRLGETWALVAVNNDRVARRVEVTLPPAAAARFGRARLGLDVPALFGSLTLSP